MASSGRAGEGADEVSNERPEDLVLPWTRDATTLNTFGTFLENDRQLLEELIQCVHKEKDAKATRQKLSLLLGTDKDRKSVVFRARVLARLIAIALGLHPDDISIDSKTGKESLRSSVDFQSALRPRLVEALQDDNSILRYLFKDALEADDEVMTVIFCDRRSFKKYPVPYFPDCDLAVEEISKLWLSQVFLRGFYYYRVLEPLFNQVKAEQLKGRGKPLKISEENLSKATMILCELLKGRTVKAGARLLVVMLSFQNDIKFHVLELANELVSPLLGFKKGKFRECFFGGFVNRYQEARWHSRGSDQVHGRHGQSITVGPSSAQSDSNLLCWAARRGYSNLISCISRGYTEACQMSPNENLLENPAEALTVKLLWKVALWCATRHGQDLVVQELAYPPWVKNINFNDYTGIQGCLPPLHLVSLLGDTRLLRMLCNSQLDIGSGAHKTDYLGKTPLDYAMQFQLTSRNSKEEMQFHVFTNDIKDRMQYEAANIEFEEWRPRRPTETYSNTRPQFESYYDGRMPHPVSYNYIGATSMPISGHRSCIQELLQMPNVADRLKELNDMYTTQANFVLIGAALIASVAFAGWLQPPLGYADYFQFTQPSPPAPAGTYEQYAAVEGHLSVQMFVVFNALSFFLGIGTMLIGAEGTLFVHDKDERTIALMKVRKSIKWMLGFFITSMVCIMAAFICAGLAILPPIQRLEWSMIVSLCLGACICLIPLTWIISSLARDQVVKLKDQLVKLIMRFGKKKKSNDSLKDLDGSLVNEEDIKRLQDEKERRCREQLDEESSSPFMESNMENQIPNQSMQMPTFRRMPSFNQRPPPRSPPLQLDDDYGYEYGHIDYPPIEGRRYLRQVSPYGFKQHEFVDGPPPVVRVNLAPPIQVVRPIQVASPIQRRHSLA